MSRRAALCWIAAAAAVFFGYAALLVYGELRGPRHLGLVPAFEDGATVVRAVESGSVAASLELAAGDRVLAVDGLPVDNLRRWLALRGGLEVGATMRWQVERGGAVRTLSLVVERAPWGARRAAGLATRLAQLAALAFAVVIAVRRPRDGIALLAAWVLATVAVGAVPRPPGSAALWHSLPLALGIPLWLPFTSVLLLGALLFSFLCVFPRPLFRSPWLWLVVWLPALWVLAGELPFFFSSVYRPRQPVVVSEAILRLATLKTLAYVAAGGAVAWIQHQRLSGITERRRVRVLAAGMALGCVPLLPELALRYLPALAEWTQQRLSLPALALLYPIGLLFPLAMAYAVLRQRLFDLGFFVRQGLRYALARGLLLSLVPLLLGLLGLDLLLHGDEPLLEVLRRRGWVYLALAALALAVRRRSDAWRDALDRRFFRERYDGERLLRKILEALRSGRGERRVATRVVASIEQALHPEVAALLVRRAGSASYDCLAAAPAGSPVPSIAVDSRLGRVLRDRRRPLAAEDAVRARLVGPRGRDFLRRARIDLLVPVAGEAPDGTGAQLALGPKRSREPYSRQDRGLLATIADSLALALAHPAAADEPPLGFALCPRCGRCQDRGRQRCPDDGASLIPVPIPRWVVGRYHLERRLGEGGMGTVYAATDSALDRSVALKLVSERLAGDATAAERFRREGRAAAGFSHPNLVTVYDFGRASGRAFLVMELLEGETLRHALRRRGRFEPADALAVLRGICAGLGEIHGRGLVHRDVKPENVFLVRRRPLGACQLLDFGIAKPAHGTEDGLTQEGLVGTLDYMAPERLLLGELDRSWDLWAATVIAYELLVGLYPFRKSPRRAWREAVESGRPMPVGEKAPDAPPTWQAFFERALAAEPEARPASAEALIAELEAVVV